METNATTRPPAFRAADRPPIADVMRRTVLAVEDHELAGTMRAQAGLGSTSILLAADTASSKAETRDGAARGRSRSHRFTHLDGAKIAVETHADARTAARNCDGSSQPRTVAGAHACIGSPGAPTAPATGAFIGASGAITQEIAPEAMAIARGRQVQNSGRATLSRAEQKRTKR
jgi:hypothetical protein